MNKLRSLCRFKSALLVQMSTVTFQTTTIQIVFRICERYLLTQWKTLKGRCDKLLKLRISEAFYRQDICVGFALKCSTIVVGINESEQYFNAILSQCFSIHQSKFPTAGHLVIWEPWPAVNLLQFLIKCHHPSLWTLRPTWIVADSYISVITRVLIYPWKWKFRQEKEFLP